MAWVVAALPAAAASWRYVRNLWINEPRDSSEKLNLHLWHQGDTFQQEMGVRLLKKCLLALLDAPKTWT